MLHYIIYKSNIAVTFSEHNIDTKKHKNISYVYTYMSFVYCPVLHMVHSNFF